MPNRGRNNVRPVGLGISGSRDGVPGPRFRWACSYLESSPCRRMNRKELNHRGTETRRNSRNRLFQVFVSLCLCGDRPLKFTRQSRRGFRHSAFRSRDRISTDRMVASEAADVGSIPAGPTMFRPRMRWRSLPSIVPRQRNDGGQPTLWIAMGYAWHAILRTSKVSNEGWVYTLKVK